MMEKIFIYFLLFICSTTLGGCSEIEHGTTDIDNWEVNYDKYIPESFIHPGIMHTNGRIAHMKSIVRDADINSVAYQTYQNLKNHNLSQSNYAMRGPFPIISRDGTHKLTKDAFEADFSAAYLNALLWAVTGEESHAIKAMEILVKYAEKLEAIEVSNDAPLLAGLQGFQIIYATELLTHTYKNASREDLVKISDMIRNVFLPVLDKFYDTPPYTNGNWGIIVTKAYLAAAILWDDVEMFRKGVKFFFVGNDNGTLPGYIDGETGQNQESGRDQGHAQLGIGGIAEICEVAYHQGSDLYGALDNRLLKGYEYTAKYNLGYDVPYFVWKDVTGKYSNWTTIGSSARGNIRAIYAIAYNHYVNRKNLSMPYTGEVLEKKPVEGYHSDNIGFGSFQFWDK